MIAAATRDRLYLTAGGRSEWIARAGGVLAEVAVAVRNVHPPWEQPQSASSAGQLDPLGFVELGGRNMDRTRHAPWPLHHRLHTVLRLDRVEPRAGPADYSD